MSLPPEYFDRLYAASRDPWQLDSRWYERRKHALTVAALPDPSYRSAFEPGCSTGPLTALLATRCDHVLATDVAPAALTAARARLDGARNVTFEQRAVPAEWPAGQFDLVVLSEVGYYLGPADLGQLAARAVAGLTSTGTLVAAHWRHRVADYPVSGETVHRALGETDGMVRTVRHDEPDFLLEVWRRGAGPAAAWSVAARTGVPGAWGVPG